VTQDCRDTLIYGAGDRVIVAVGVEDLIVVDTADALLICPRGRAQDVKAIVEQLELERRDEYL
jgi:mannose-1-phosphate guanylyltransferase